MNPWLLNLVYDACFHGDVEALRLILSPDVPIDLYYVHQAASQGHIQVLSFLLTNGNHDLQGLFKYAYLNRHPTAVEFLLQHNSYPATIEELQAEPPFLPGDHPGPGRDAACQALVKMYQCYTRV